MSWWELLAIAKEARIIRNTQAAMAPVSCPNDGTILLRDRQNRLRCNYCGWIWDGVRNPLVDQSPDNLTPAQGGNPLGPGT